MGCTTVWPHMVPLPTFAGYRPADASRFSILPLIAARNHTEMLIRNIKFLRDATMRCGKRNDDLIASVCSHPCGYGSELASRKPEVDRRADQPLGAILSLFRMPERKKDRAGGQPPHPLCQQRRPKCRTISSTSPPHPCTSRPRQGTDTMRIVAHHSKADLIKARLTRFEYKSTTIRTKTQRARP